MNLSSETSVLCAVESVGLFICLHTSCSLLLNFLPANFILSSTMAFQPSEVNQQNLIITELNRLVDGL